MNRSKNKFKLSGLQPHESVRGSSSIAGTETLRYQLPEIFSKHSITSMFDAGSNDAVWARLLSEFVNYSGGDINVDAVNSANQMYPELNIIEFDILADRFPAVDLLFVRDVSIHLTNEEKSLLLNNFINSDIPWLMITQLPYIVDNHDIPATADIVTAETNWCIAPWYFPDPVDCAYEFNPGGRCMAMWHRDQIKDRV
jgi:hypothetical protein